MKTLILYHANCADGFCAAWIAHRKWGEDADYLPVQYGQEPPDVTGRAVYILDFSYKRPVMRQILSQAQKVVVLDHHKTAEAELVDIIDEFVQRPDLIANPSGSELPVVHFDMSKSGGRLAWGFFFPGKPTPWLVDYTEDRDLWSWKLPNSREISAALAARPKTFGEWYALDQFPSCPGELIREGVAILRYQQQQIDAICANASETEIDGHQILAVNTSVLFSEVAGKLAEGRPFGAAWFVRGDGKKQWSLRSQESGVDVSEIARRHGGGGHHNAAGFEEVLSC